MVLELLERIVWECWLVLGQMSPYLLFGFLVAGILSVCIAPAFVERHLGGSGFGPVLKAALLGIPLPLCSCSVIPVSVSLRRHGASRAATTSFLLSTPQTGVDSIAATYALLGTLFAVYRPIVALMTGIVGGGLVMIFARSANHEKNDSNNQTTCHACCCEPQEKPRQQNAVIRAIRYGFVTLPRDIGIPLLIGVLIAGLVGSFVEPGGFDRYIGGGFFSMVAMMILGIPLYVCATASVPIAAALIYAGASPGAALAFLIAGPATNAATISAIWNFLGSKAAMLYFVAICLSAIGGGLLLDFCFSYFGMTPPVMSAHHHQSADSVWLSTIWAVILLVVIAVSYLANLRENGYKE